MIIQTTCKYHRPYTTLLSAWMIQGHSALKDAISVTFDQNCLHVTF